MSDEAVLEHLEQVHAYAREYLADAAGARPFPTDEAVANLSRFDEPWPDRGTSGRELLAALHEIGSPATTRTTGGRYYGFVMGGCLPAALGANWLAAAWDQCATTHATSPVGTRIEEVAAGWVLEALDLPRDSAVGFVSGASVASFCAIASARSALLARAGWDLRERGVRGAPDIRIVASEEEHPTVRKALTMLGIGQSEVCWAETDEQGRVIAEALPPLDERTVLLLQAGNVNSGSFDPFEAICGKAREAGAWVHVDGAFGLWARACSSRRHLAAGVELADSWAVDGHKWLNVPYDSAVYICRDKAAPESIFSTHAPYLVRSEAREPSYLTPELSRRSRGIEIWAAMKSLGRSGLDELIERCCRHARRFAEGLEAAGFEILNDVVINQVVATSGTDEEMRELVRAIQKSGVCWLGPTYWRGRVAMRISVSSWATSDNDVERSLEAMIDCRNRLKRAS